MSRRSPVSREFQGVPKSRFSSEGRRPQSSSESEGAGGFTSEFAPPLLQTGAQPVSGPSGLRSIRGGAGDLLGVREVAKRLSVSTSTVYALVERGELRHVRVSNAIRIAPADLAQFLRDGSDGEGTR